MTMTRMEVEPRTEVVDVSGDSVISIGIAWFVAMVAVFMKGGFW